MIAKRYIGRFKVGQKSGLLNPSHNPLLQREWNWVATKGTASMLVLHLLIVHFTNDVLFCKMIITRRENTYLNEGLGVKLLADSSRDFKKNCSWEKTISMSLYFVELPLRWKQALYSLYPWLKIRSGITDFNSDKLKLWEEVSKL